MVIIAHSQRELVVLKRILLGKTTTSEMIASVTGLEHINVGELVRQKQLHEGYLVEFDTHVLDEDKVINIYNEKNLYLMPSALVAFG